MTLFSKVSCRALKEKEEEDDEEGKKWKKKTELPVLMFKKTAVLAATYQRPVNWRAHFPSGDGTYWTLAQCDLQMMWVGCSNEFNQPKVLNAITKYHLLYLAQRSAPGSLCKNAGSQLETLASENIRFSMNHYLQSILPFQYPSSLETDRIQNAIIFPHPPQT